MPGRATQRSTRRQRARGDPGQSHYGGSSGQEWKRQGRQAEHLRIGKLEKFQWVLGSKGGFWLFGT